MHLLDKFLFDESMEDRETYEDVVTMEDANGCKFYAETFSCRNRKNSG